SRARGRSRPQAAHSQRTPRRGPRGGHPRRPGWQERRPRIPGDRPRGSAQTYGGHRRLSAFFALEPAGKLGENAKVLGVCAHSPASLPGGSAGGARERKGHVRMATRLYVGNLSYNTSEEALREAFAAEGRQVSSVSIITDRMTGQPRGFAFVEMNTQEDA